jgi:hypothetical protein
LLSFLSQMKLKPIAILTTTNQFKSTIYTIIPVLSNIIANISNERRKNQSILTTHNKNAKKNTVLHNSKHPSLPTTHLPKMQNNSNNSQ